jgi:hypothetical protein
MNDFTEKETEILKVAIRKFANNTTNLGHRRAEFELELDEEIALTSLIGKFDVDLVDDEIS